MGDDVNTPSTPDIKPKPIFVNTDKIYDVLKIVSNINIKIIHIRKKIITKRLNLTQKIHYENTGNTKHRILLYQLSFTEFSCPLYYKTKLIGWRQTIRFCRPTKRLPFSGMVENHCLEWTRSHCPAVRLPLSGIVGWRDKGLSAK